MGVQLGDRSPGEAEAEAGLAMVAQQTRRRLTYTQVPGVQLYLLFQLCEQLIVERLQLEAGRKHC